MAENDPKPETLGAHNHLLSDEDWKQVEARAAEVRAEQDKEGGR